MDQYKSYLQNLANSDSQTEFYNSGPEHAALVMTTIFDKAKSYVKIYAGGFTGEVSGNSDYRKSLQKFISRGGNVKVLLQANKIDKLEDTEIFKLLKFNQRISPEQVSVRKHAYTVTGPNENEVHFTTADHQMYRLEEDTEKFTATGNFNNSSKVEQIEKVFDEIFSNAETQIIL